MKFIVSAVCLLAIALVFVACGDKSNDANSESTVNTEHADHADHAEHAEHPEHPTATSTDGLVLNDGEKWQMDPHTRDSFAKMATSFVNVDAASLDAASLQKAGANLKSDLDGLIKGCTMTGADHDQLHVYLTAYIPAVAALQAEGKLEDATKVQHYLSIYGDYFE